MEEVERARRYVAGMADIAPCKGWNDKFGHLLGDELLGQVCRFFSVRPKNDALFRHDGEEFVPTR
jgi:GGDEF domain-containing protein